MKKCSGWGTNPVASGKWPGDYAAKPPSPELDPYRKFLALHMLSGSANQAYLRNHFNQAFNVQICAVLLAIIFIK